MSMNAQLGIPNPAIANSLADLVIDMVISKIILKKFVELFHS